MNNNMNNNRFVQELISKLEEVRAEIVDLKNTVKLTLNTIEEKQRAADYIIELLSYENVNFDEIGIEKINSKSIPDFVEEELKELNEKKALHYNEIYNLITSKGIPVPGKNPEANLLTQISRDSRFIRTAPGTYGLKEWGLTPIKKKSKARRKK